MYKLNNISIKDLLDILLKNLIIIILAAVICAAGAYVYCEKFTEEKFASHGSILVTNGGIITDDQGKPVENSQIAASINLLPTIQKLLASPDIYETVAEQFNNKYTAGQLMGAMRLSDPEEHSLVLDITFVLSSKEDVPAVTNAFLEAASKYMASLIEGTRIYITAPASGAYKTAPQTAKTTVTAFAVGALICYAILFLIFILNITIKSDEDFASHYDVPVIGNIPDFDAKINKKTCHRNKN